MPITRSHLDLRYLHIPVAATKDGAVYDPTSDSVQMAFTANGASPASGDWKAASWETAGAVHMARCLVGPGGAVTLAVGKWWVWVKVTDTPEIPVQQADVLTIV